MGLRMQNIALFAICGLIALLAPVALLFNQPAPQVGEVALIISAPWGPSTFEILQGRAAWEISPVRAPFGALVMIEDPQGVERLYDNGAWIVANGKRILELCT